MFDPPALSEPDEVPEQPLFTPAEAATVATLYGVTLDPERGHAVVVVRDCNLARVVGATVTVSDAGGAAIGYTAGALPSPAATATDATGVAGILNATPGWHTVSAVGSNGERWGRGRVLVLAGSFTLGFVTPMQTTPDLSCNGHPQEPTAVAETVDATVTVIDFASRAPLGAVTVKVCAREDFDCAAPLAAGTTAEDGTFTFALEATVEGFDGYFETTGEALFPRRGYYNPPLRSTGHGPLQLVEEVLTTPIANLFATLSGAEIDPAFAHMAFATTDCKLLGAHGMAVAVTSGTTPKTKVVYVEGGSPVPDATMTSLPSLGGVFNVAVDGSVTLTATYLRTGEVVGKVTLTPKQGYLHAINIIPSAVSE